jgi:hypothetical protein
VQRGCRLAAQVLQHCRACSNRVTDKLEAVVGVLRLLALVVIKDFMLYLCCLARLLMCCARPAGLWQHMHRILFGANAIPILSFWTRLAPSSSGSYGVRVQFTF